MPVVGSRFIVEAGFIIAVAVIAGIERLSTWWIIAVVAGAWLIVAAVEIAVWARKVGPQQPQAVDEPADPEPAPTPEYASRQPVVVRPQPSVETREAKPSSEPEPEQTQEPERSRIVSVPALPPEPEPELEAEPEEPGRVVAFLPANDSPREWNLWELERAARDHGGDDLARNEERSYLLIYLREFAGPDGTLPADFDALVRESFGDVLHGVA